MMLGIDHVQITVPASAVALARAFYCELVGLSEVENLTCHSEVSMWCNVECPKPRWSLLGTSTNSYGVTFFSLSCRDKTDDDGDYKVLLQLLKEQFGAVETGQLVGPYSVHKYLKVEGLCLGLILDSPDWLDLFTENQGDTPALESFVAKVLDALSRRG
jgi:hypothetical protein